MKMKMVCLLLLFLFAFPVSHSSPSSHSDEDALLAFKTSLSLDSHNSLHDWSSNSSFCNWTGVVCSSRHQRVVSLNLTEYGMGGKISTKGDVYSYGILILELLTRRRPTDNMFVEGINLPKWASMHFPNKITEVVDNQLLIDVEESNKEMVLACLTEVIQIGLICTREDPHQRPTMMEIVQRLEKVTSLFLGTPRDFHLPIDISPFLESTHNQRNTNEESSGNWSTSTY
ncbi:putative leucine-rich repeat receptor-like serine/threonine-protein kinase At2g24130 isoform X2 [Cryptomeria japonica]|uniref:putative leucine-rich repeat receptor-like serine/threonine-protein kinase At2g24130 isoform X2 n=1 Tax=Cryptomeria japonica TaxID=3369 RepID=UPI0027DA4D11|nr:putative leucine-rich repeat receptor-like serine/threonine-protein kinase At2g24130 isoform X2 [Cryptomeria japonica]